MIEIIVGNIFLFVEALIYSVAIVILCCGQPFPRKLLYLCSSFIFYSLFGLGLGLINTSWLLVAAIDILILTIFTTTVFKIKSSYAAFSTISIHYLFVITDLLLGTVISIFTDTSLFELMVSPAFLHMYSLVSKLVSAVLIFCFVYILKRITHHLPTKYLYYLSAINFTAVVIVSLIAVYIEPTISSESTISVFFILLCLLLMTFTFLSLYVLLAKYHYKEEFHIIMDETSKRLSSEIRTLDEAKSTYRKFQHDWSNNIATIMHMFCKGATDDIHKYLYAMAEAIPVLDSVQYCDIASIDAVLNIKQRKCKEGSIPLDLSISPLFIDFINQIDIASLIANLLDNAINAQLLLPESDRRIVMAINRANQLIAIKISNTIDEKMHTYLREAKPILVENREHGWGLIIAKDICERYKGSLHIKVVPNTIEVQALLIDEDPIT